MTKLELFEQIKRVRSEMKKKENCCDGMYELLEDHLSDLLDDIREMLKENYKEIKYAQDKGYNVRLPLLYCDRKELNDVLYDF